MFHPINYVMDQMTAQMVEMSVFVVSTQPDKFKNVLSLEKFIALQ